MQDFIKGSNGPTTEDIGKAKKIFNLALENQEYMGILREKLKQIKRMGMCGIKKSVSMNAL